MLTTLVVQAEAGGGETKGFQPIATSTATLTEMPILDIPQAVNVVTNEVIVDQNARTLDQVLANVSNVTQANTLGGTQDAFIRRGFGDNRDGSVLTNGLRSVWPRSFNATADRVEVVKGPASTLYGIQEPGGIINIITKTPQQTFGGSLGGTLSSFGGGYADFDITGPVAGTNFAYRLIAEYQDTDYWRNFGTTRQNVFAPSVSWYGEDATVTVAYTHRDYTVPFDRGTIFDLNTGKAVNVDRRTRFDEAYNVTEGSSDLFQINAERQLSDNWKLKVNYGYSRDIYSDNQSRVIAYNATTGALTRRADATQDSTQYDHNVRADLAGTVNIAGFKNELLFGASYNYYDLLRTDMIRCANRTGFNIYRPVYGQLSPCTTVSASDSDQTTQQSVYNGYAQDALYLTDQWIVVAGGSFQYYDQMAGKGRPFNLNTEADGSEFMPRAGIVYKATDKLSFYANYATSFVPQTSIASYIGNLPPETGVSYEAGVKFDMLKGLTATAAVFDIEKENVLYTEVIGGESYARTAGKVRSQGFEFDVAGAVTDRINLIASYGYTDAVVVEDPDYQGNTPTNVARHTYSLFATYDFGKVWGDNRLKVGGGMHGRSRAPGDPANDFWLPAYTVFDALIAYTIQAKNPITVQLNVKNIFDTTYYTSTQATNLGVEIGDPLEALLSARVSF
ncbi:TonB-dependent siderophore receptor [Azorhizobium doebereinerae]|uniref:TonB-dependent siderophore receptor n=1 Tax=Azorhizobium doebereinerae TaxID=281091 RepID=UPI0006844C43|nr:TonB-dependent siderophore receptor [Azorhizobium doebereinerae]